MSLVYIIEVVIGIGLLIFVHELGHFIVAKLSGVKVEKFSLGFGPEFVGVTSGETRYSLRIVPLGGYVKMQGDEPGADIPEPERSFLTQSFTKKALIVVAGSFMNIITALILFVAVFSIGIQFPAAKLGTVEYGMPAYFAGLRVGDDIVAVNGNRDVDFMDVATTAALADPGQSMQLLVDRGGVYLPVTVHPWFSREAGTSTIGVGAYPTLVAQGFESLDGTESPAQKAGVEIGDTMTAFNGEPLKSAFDLERRISANGVKPFKLTVKRGATEETFDVTPLRNPQPLMGIRPQQTTRVTDVAPGSIAEAMGLESSDTIVALGDKPESNLLDLTNDITVSLKNLPPLYVQRGDKKLELIWTKPLASAFDFISGFDTEVLPRLAAVEPDSPADVMGLKAGDVITAIDGRPVKEYKDLQLAMKESKGDTITVAWERTGYQMKGAFQPTFIGLLPGVEMVKRQMGFASACSVGLKKAWSFASQIYLLVKKIFNGQPTIAKNLRGPVFIAQASYQVAQRGFTELLFFLAVIGINLGVVNLLPIPILDGGLLAVFIFEKLKGSPISVTSQAVLQYVGLALIVTLFIYVTFNDILRLFTGG